MQKGREGAPEEGEAAFTIGSRGLVRRRASAQQRVALTFVDPEEA